VFKIVDPRLMVVEGPQNTPVVVFPQTYSISHDICSARAISIILIQSSILNFNAN
jgi:hypothetical protein